MNLKLTLKHVLFFMCSCLLIVVGCKDDENEPTVIDFGDAPSSSLISTGSVNVISEDLIRYHVVNFQGAYTSTIVESETGVVLVDVGPSFIPNAGLELKAYVDAIGKAASIIITHNHGDHYGNLPSFTDATVYAEAAVAAICSNDLRFTDVYSGTINSITTSETIEGLDFSFDKVSNAETGENGYIYLPEHKALFPGDLVYNQAHNFIREYTPKDNVDELDNWISGLNQLKSSFGDYSYVFVGHNGSRTDISTAIDENIQYLQDAQGLIKQTKELAAGGMAQSNQDVVDELQILYPNYLTSGLLFALPDAFFPGDPGADWF